MRGEVIGNINKPHPPQRSSSIRLRRRRDEVKQQFVKNRRSGEFGYRLDNSRDNLNNPGTEEIGDSFECNETVVRMARTCKDDTLDPTTADSHIKHNLRPLIRNKFKLTDFGLIDSPLSQQHQQHPPPPAIPEHPLSQTGRRKPRESFPPDDDDEEDTAKMSMNCFSGNIKTLEKENYTSLSRKRSPPSYSDTSSAFPLHRALMWVQKGKLLSRWKERFIVITEEYIQCFKKGMAQLSQMGDFMFQIGMKDVRSVSLVDRRGYLTVVLELEGDIPGLVVRKPEGLRDWYNIVQKQVKDAKARVMLSTEQFWTKKNSGQEVDTADTEWLVSRRSAAGYHYSDRPASVASVDRRQQRYRHRHHRQYGDFPDESSTLSKLSKKSKPRSRSVDRDRSTKAGAGGRSVSVSEDSGNSSLNTYATDTIQTSNSDWVTAPQRNGLSRGYNNMGWY